MSHPDDKTRLSYWFPLIEAAGLPVPRTKIVRCNGDLSCMGDGKEPDCLASLEAEIRIASSGLGVPYFLRTDFTSGKHEWRDTCFVADPSKLRQHIFHLWECSELSGILGLPTDVWVVRELLNTRPAFHAFRGMPIVREFRFFVRDGDVEHVQPYWPPDSIQKPDREDWQERLAEISQLDADQFVRFRAMNNRVSSALGGGYWSVDWLQTADRGWVLTDIAEGEKSYRWSSPTPGGFTVKGGQR